MHVVTEIKPAVRNQNRVNVFLDGKYTFSLDIAQVVDMGIKVGQRLSETEVEEYREASEFGKLYQRTLEWALIRPRSVREMREYLRKKQTDRKIKSFRCDCGLPQKETTCLSGQMISRVIERLVRKGYVDDRKFAEYYVENRFVKKGVSKKRMRQELMRKGIDKQLIDEVLTNGARNDADEIRKMIVRKRDKYDDDKLIAYLVRQGFDYQEAKDAVAASRDD